MKSLLGLASVVLVSLHGWAADTPAPVPVPPAGPVTNAPVRTVNPATLPMMMRPPPADLVASDRKLAALAKAWREEADAAKKAVLAQSLREELKANQVIRQRIRAEHIAQLEAELARMKQLQAAEEAQMAERIEARFKQLTERPAAPVPPVPAPPKPAAR